MFVDTGAKPSLTRGYPPHPSGAAMQAKFVGFLTLHGESVGHVGSEWHVYTLNAGTDAQL
jgi:hypothetical protein